MNIKQWIHIFNIPIRLLKLKVWKIKNIRILIVPDNENNIPISWDTIWFE